MHYLAVPDCAGGRRPLESHWISCSWKEIWNTRRHTHTDAFFSPLSWHSVPLQPLGKTEKDTNTCPLAHWGVFTFCPIWKVQHAFLKSTEDSQHRIITLFTTWAVCQMSITSPVVFHIYIIQSDWTVENSQSSPVFNAQNCITKIRKPAANFVKSLWAHISCFSFCTDVHESRTGSVSRT